MVACRCWLGGAAACLPACHPHSTPPHPHVLPQRTSTVKADVRSTSPVTCTACMAWQDVWAAACASRAATEEQPAGGRASRCSPVCMRVHTHTTQPSCLECSAVVGWVGAAAASQGERAHVGTVCHRDRLQAQLGWEAAREVLLARCSQQARHSQAGSLRGGEWAGHPLPNPQSHIPPNPQSHIPHQTHNRLPWVQ